MEHVTFRGKELTLKGSLPKVGQKAPDAEGVDGEMKPVKLSSFKNKALLLLTVPSLDTPTCSKEAHHFNQAMAQWASALEVVVVSMDLPFAQKRFCTEGAIKNLKTLSDFKKREFGELFGLRIEELGLLARAAFLIDNQGVIRYVQLVKEISEEPKYEEVLKACKELLVKTA